MEKLAIKGGAPIREKKYPLWPKSGEQEQYWINKVLSGQKWFAGPRGDDSESLCALFGNRFAALHASKYGVLVSNGSVSIEISLKALGIKPGDEVIVPAYTFISTATSALMIGAIPVFGDISNTSYCLDPRDLERKITSATKAIIPVHLGGQMADMPMICSIAKKHGLKIVEDCAQAIGSAWMGKSAGTWGDLGSFSFQSNKTLTSGEGGLVLTNSDDLAERVRALCAFGRTKSSDAERSSAYQSQFLSSNYRLSEVQAAILLAQLERFASQDDIRQKNAAYLNNALKNIPGISPIKVEADGSKHGYYYYLMRYDKNAFGNLSPNALSRALVAEGVPFIPGDDRPIYHGEVFQPKNLKQFLHPELLDLYQKRNNASNANCPQAEKACKNTLILRHQVLLGDQKSMDDIITALDKVQKNIDQLI